MRGPRDQHGQSFEKGDGLEPEVRSAIRPRMPQRDPDLPLRVDAQPRLRDRWPQRVAAHPLEPLALACRHDQPGVQIEALHIRVTRAERDRGRLLGRAAGPATRAPARSPSATSPCTDAAARPASTGGSSAHVSAVPLSSDVAATSRRCRSRSIRCATTATTSATSSRVRRRAG
jgi:hypothetical protein